jgi:hypothetical protein
LTAESGIALVFVVDGAGCADQIRVAAVALTPPLASEGKGKKAGGHANKHNARKK